MRLECPAKINLDLRVGPPRADGFHPIRSWFVTVGLYDVLEVGRAEGREFVCDGQGVPNDATNLVCRAAEAMDLTCRGWSIRLNKRIPAGGGLGGGSSDAAHTLLALNRLYNLGYDRARLADIAATLGSDVPFFLHGPSAVCRGRGERIAPVPPPTCPWAVLILSEIAMPTPAVFRRLDELRPAADFDDAFTPPAATTADALLPTLFNDLERPAFDLRPELGRLRADAEQALGRPVRMSGSGSTLFTLYDEEGPAEAAAAGFAMNGASAKAVRIAPAENGPGGVLGPVAPAGPN